MAKYCSDCTNFNTNKKKDGINGYCQCTKQKKFVLANMPACEKFGEAYSRRSYEKEKLYDDAKNATSKFSGKETSILVPIVLIILYIILKIFKIV